MIKRLFTLSGAIAARLFSRFSDICNRIFRLQYSGWWSARLNAPGLTMKPRVNSIIGLGHIRIGRDCAIGKGAVISAWESFHGEKFSPEIVIGDDVRLGDFIHITCIDRIEIEDGVLTGRWVTITDNSHGDNSPEQLREAPDRRPLKSAGRVVIGKNAWLGDKVTILPGVSIGEGAVVGAGAVVTKDIPAFCIAGGIPAKIIRDFRRGTVKKTADGETNPGL